MQSQNAQPDDFHAEQARQSQANLHDLSLIRKAAKGQSAAFHELVDRHAERLYRLAFSLIGNAADAEDVVQETLAGAFRGLSKFEERASVKTWLTRILLTQAARWRRENKRRRDVPRINESQADPRDAVEQRLDLQAAMMQLSDEHRQVLSLREFEHLSYEEIAAVLDVPRGTVESRLHRARAELRERLKAWKEA